MGGRGAFLQTGGFSKQEYKQVRELIEGIKVIKHITDPHTGMPIYSNTPDTMYLREDNDGHISQLRIYKGREPYLDIDWGHNHGNFHKGTPHVQEWHKSQDGKLHRDKDPRSLTTAEKKRFYDLFKKLGINLEKR